MKTTKIDIGRYYFGPFILAKKGDKSWFATIDNKEHFETSKNLLMEFALGSEEMKKWETERIVKLQRKKVGKPSTFEHGACHICEGENGEGYRFSPKGVFQCLLCRNERNQL
tara:strand:- start:653 stop:988 length:336 start_codon:yes stop_codon:yes gene_type:complete